MSSWGRGVAGRRGLTIGVAIVVLTLLAASAPGAPWRFYVFRQGMFVPLDLSGAQCCLPAVSVHPPATPSTWQVAACALADVTGDDAPEWALVVWRPWRDWPIQRWSAAPSPIAAFHDAGGSSCHLILLDPRNGRQVWAGSALPAPLVDMAVGDVDGDGANEVIALEGTYAAGRAGPAYHITVWKWNGFGFTLVWRSPRGVFYQLGLTDADNDDILEIAVR